MKGTGDRSSYGKRLAWAWLNKRRPDVIEQIRAAQEQKFPLKKRVAEAGELPKALADMK